MFAQRIGQSPGTPQKHPTVPKVISRGHKCRRLFGIRFFGETAYTKSVAAEQPAHFDVSVAGFGAIWTDPENDNIIARGCNLDSAFDGRAIAFFIGDHMIGSEHADHRIRILAQKKERSETDRRCSVASQWLGENLRTGQLRKLPHNSRTQVIV